MIQSRYRADYTGEFVIVDTVIANGSTVQTREWIDNPIINHHISNRAAVIGSRCYSHKFQHQRLQKHRGGLLGKKRLQTYGTSDLWRDMKFDFFVTSDPDQLKDLTLADYDKNSTVYSTARACINHPGRLYLVPYMPPVSDIALPIYLAAFDGHAEVFLLGYNLETPALSRNWVQDVDQVLAAYAGTKFWLIGVEANMPEIWRNHSNVACMNLRTFISYCDI